MRKFHPSCFGYGAVGKDTFITSGITYEHSCTACGKRHPHSGELVVTRWCNECSAISIYKAASKTMLPSNSPRQMISVVV